MRLLLLRLLACIGAICTAGVVRAECRLTLVSQLPFTVSPSGHLLVSIMLNDQPAQMVFDTGFSTSVISLKTADRIGLPHMHDQDVEGWIGQVSGIGGSKAAMVVTARKVDVGGLIGKNYNFVSADIGSHFAEGLLSVDLISRYDIDLDFPENQIVLYRPNGDCSAPSAFLASPLYSAPLLPVGSDQRPRLTVSVGGKELTAMIDTGAPHSAIFRRAAERLGLHMESLADDPHSVAGGVGPHTVKAVRHAFEPVSIGDLEFDNMKVDILDEHGDTGADMLLGGDFQRAVHLWISYSSQTLIMQYPPRPSKKPVK
jgi:predicted aspartyl protease